MLAGRISHIPEYKNQVPTPKSTQVSLPESFAGNSEQSNNQELYFTALQNYNLARLSFTGVIKNSNTITGSAIGVIRSKDNNYRAHLAKCIDCRPENLSSIVGLHELNYVLGQLKPEQYNPHSSAFAVNLHSHTINSDGKLTVEELLNKMAHFANTKATTHPVYFSITNHNDLSGIYEMLNIISEKPETYKNLRIIPGIEFDTVYNNPDYFDRPVKLDIVAHGIDPYDTEFVKFVDDIAKNHRLFGEKYFKDLEQLGIYYSKEKKDEICNLSMSGGSEHFIGEVKRLVIEDLHQQIAQKPALKQQVNNVFNRYKEDQPVIPLGTLVKSFNNYQGQCGLAHPGKIDVRASLKDGKTPEEAISTLVKFFKSAGGAMGESYYQYPDSHYKKEQNKYHYNIENWLKFIDRLIEDNGLVKSGGIDNHGKSIYGRH
jgi:hypothetical protein